MKSKTARRKPGGLDISIICFLLVLAAAIPVAWLRTKTYALGYELGKLKHIEEELRQQNALLSLEIYEQQKIIRSNLSEKSTDLHFPQPNRVLHASEK